MKIFFAGGGTGGHIYPAIAIADAILKIQPQAQIEFVGTSRGLENKLVPKAGFKLNHIDIGRLNKNVGLVERIKTLALLPLALFKALILIFKFDPDIVVGVGGYASAPVALMASLLGKKVFIWEPNAYPGMANRILSRFVSRCLIVFEESKKYLKNKNIEVVPMPVRTEIESIKAPLKTNTNSFEVLVFGGSQGARPINNVISQAIALGGDWLEKTHVVHQTGPYDYQQIQAFYKNKNLDTSVVEVHEYLHDMPERYNRADLIISRAGTGTISELAACGKASILVPLPSAADDHQTKKCNGFSCESECDFVATK